MRRVADTRSAGTDPLSIVGGLHDARRLPLAQDGAGARVLEPCSANPARTPADALTVDRRLLGLDRIYTSYNYYDRW